MREVVAIATNKLGASSETFVQRHVASLNGGQTVVLCRRMDGDRAAAGKPVMLIGESDRALPWRLAGLPRVVWNRLRWGGIAYPSHAMDRAIARFLSAHEVGCVLAEFGPMGCILQRAAAIAGTPLFVYFRGRDATALLARPGVRRAYARMFPDVDGVVAVSRFLLDRLSNAGFRHPNSHVIPSGVNTETFSPGDKDPNLLLFVGRFVDKKSPDLAIRGFAEIVADYPVRLDMIGEGPLLDSCRRLAARLGVDGRVRFLGARSHEFVAARMAQARILLNHSVVARNGDAEGLPSVIQEGMAAGAVVIATCHAGIPEAISSGVNGYLVNEGDLDAVVFRLRELMENPRVADQLAERARDDAVSGFDSLMQMHRLEDVVLASSRVESTAAMDP